MNQLLFYLIQVIAASGLLYGYYHFALRNKKFHRYNRFYLLMAVTISTLIPFLSIPVYFSENETGSSVVLQTLQVISSPVTEPPASTVSIIEITRSSWFTVERMLYGFYFLVILFFLLRVLISLNKIRFIVKRNPAEQIDKIKFINTDEPGAPFSFFRWLFWNRKIELHSEKGEQIFRHELFHIQQQHSWDIIFMEFISTIFWINPFFHLIKKELKAIHEFLADEFAIKENKNWQYAELLLMQVLNTNNHLVNPFFHNQIKRRIAMITSFQKPRHQYLRKLLVLPITMIVLGLFAFSYKQKNRNPIKEIINIQDTIKPKQENILMKISMPPLKPFSKAIPDEELLKKWQDSKTYGVWIDNKRIDNSKLKSYNSSDFSHYFVSKLSKNAVNYGKHYYQINLMTNRYYENYLKNFDYNKQFTITRVVAQDTIPKVLVKFEDYLIIIDGEIKDKASLETVIADSIESITILRDKAAIDKYVDKGKNGVIEVKTKKTGQVLIKEVAPEELKDSTLKPGNDQDNIVFEKVEIEPSFPGGEKEWRRYLERNLDASMPGKNGCQSGSYTVVIQFIIDKEGNPVDLKPLTKYGYGMEDQVMYLIKKGPRWIPGKQNGKIVKAYKKQPVTFVIGDGKPDLSKQVTNSNGEKTILNEIVVVSFEDNKVFEKVQIEASYPGGEKAWREFINKNLNVNVPVSKKAPERAYTVVLQFIVDKEGNINDLKALTKHGYGMEDESLRVMSLSPKWNPAIQNGHVVKAYRKQPFNFVITEE